MAGMLQMLMDTNLDATQKKIESGRLELETVPFHIHIVLDIVLSLFSAKTQVEGINLPYTYPCLLGLYFLPN